MNSPNVFVITDWRGKAVEKIGATIAITGMNATDNPAPGVAVARALRHESSFEGRIVGLGYNALDPGFYKEGLVDAASVMPFPSAGKDAFLEHLEQVDLGFGIDVLMPTLDSELRAVIALESKLTELKIRTFLPSLEALERSSKPHLPKLMVDNPEIQIPESEAIVSPEAIGKLIRKYGLPIMIKGVYYGGDVAKSESDAVFAFHRYVANWGLPVIVQKFVGGEEYNIAAIGDGAGNTIGAVAMRKMALTDKGKGWSGVTVDNPKLIELTEAIIGTLKWRGPLEVEVLRENDTGELFVVEINPRFPAWIYLSAGAGLNLPYLCVLMALGLPLPKPIPKYKVGTLFVRISIDQIADLETYGKLSSLGLVPMQKVSK